MEMMDVFSDFEKDMSGNTYEVVSNYIEETGTDLPDINVDDNGYRTTLVFIDRPNNPCYSFDKVVNDEYLLTYRVYEDGMYCFNICKMK